ncbi:Hypothetical predicted protein [Pelobates cultripes]|uniref:Uncharacterized protein n=1 Tax=Pelobates cultripes TaxID=61616 RepID=A0AAD1RXF5_PELCU|nr:Hypothetical predicted protein [Pelobates cultripes]
MDWAHRALRPPALNPDSPRDVIVHMHFFTIKKRILNLARATLPQHQGSRLAFFKDLAPSTLKKRGDLKQLTLMLNHLGLRYMWGHPFKLIVRKDNQTHILKSATEMTPFAESLGLTIYHSNSPKPWACTEDRDHKGSGLQTPPSKHHARWSLLNLKTKTKSTSRAERPCQQTRTYWNWLVTPPASLSKP